MPDPKIRAVQRTIVRWFLVHQRNLPWRRTRDPYRILVSEMMLQQTQVDRVIPKYREFLRRFPSVQALARATPRDVLLAWAGMGYNRRALYLLRAAREIVERYGGKAPTDPALLQTLPGVGPYTAAAVATFSTGVPHALADTNVRRVIGRVFLGVPRRAWNESRLWNAIERSTPRRPVVGMPAALWGHAVMDFGALVCKAKPKCEICPLQQWCKAYPAVQQRTGDKKRGTRQSGSLFRVPSFRLAPQVPDRIYRGRILQALRERDPAFVSLSELAVLLREVSRPRLRLLIRGLAADGLLMLSHGQRAQLPRGEAMRVPA